MHGVLIIDFAAGQQRSALRIHNDFDLALFDDRIVLSELRLEGHAVLVAMAAAAFDEDAQADRILLFHEEFPNLLFSRWRHGDHGISPYCRWRTLGAYTT